MKSLPYTFPNWYHQAHNSSDRSESQGLTTMRSSAGSVTNYLDQLKEGERDAVQQLWERYSSA